MARPRTPKAKAMITGHALTQKRKFEGRNEPQIDEALGNAPERLPETEKNKAVTAWETIRRDIPWLNSSHRILVATASNILGLLIAGQECGTQALNLLRQCLGQMGATPADRHRVPDMPADGGDDPADEFFS